jgi:transposase
LRVTDLKQQFNFYSRLQQLCTIEIVSMAKDKEKRIAFDYYTNQGLTAKAIADIVNVSEKTIGDWVEKGNWKAVRDANLNGAQTRSANIKELISELTDQQLEINIEIKEAKAIGDKDRVIALRQQSATISQEVAIQTKALERMDSDNKISLSTYLEVMNDIFKNLEHFDKDVYLKTLDFQESHLSTISIKLG